METKNASMSWCFLFAGRPLVVNPKVARFRAGCVRGGFLRDADENEGGRGHALARLFFVEHVLGLDRGFRPVRTPDLSEAGEVQTQGVVLASLDLNGELSRHEPSLVY